MIRRTVFRGRNNPVVLQLTEDNEPLADPAAFDRIELCIGSTEVEVDTTDPNLTYDNVDGVLTALLGLVAVFTALPDGDYRCKVTGYGPGNAAGTVFGSVVLELRPAC